MLMESRMIEAFGNGSSESPTAFLGIGDKATQGNNGLPVNFSFTQPNGDGFESKSNSWLRVGVFIYNGTASTDGVITKAVVIAYTTNVSTYHRWRIMNVSTATIIATSTQVNTGTLSAPVSVDLGVISNLPAGPSADAQFEVQLLATDATGNTGIVGTQLVGIFTIQVYP